MHYLIKLKNILKYKYIILLVIILIYSFIRINLPIKSKYSNENNIYGYIDSYYIKDNKLTLTLIAKEKIICKYYFNNEIDINNFINNYFLGDYILLKGSLEKPTENRIFNLFNYKEYLKNEGINFIFEIDSYEKIKPNNKIIYSIKNTISNKINKSNNKEYLYAFILGNTKYIDTTVMDSYRTNGISHLFSISGMHISLISLILLKIFKNKDIIVLLFILFYVILINSPSIIRSGIFFILLTINKSLKLNISNINLMIILLFICIIIDPFIITKIGFIYSYVISLTLIIFSDLIKKSKYKLLMISFISFIISIPITINNFFEINIISIIYNLFFVPLISTIIFPMTLISIILPIEYILNIFINVVEVISLYLSNIKIFIIPLSKLSILGIIIYYVVIIYVLLSFRKNNYKNILIIILAIIIHFNINIFNPYSSVTFIDVGQGDSSLIMMPNNKLNILIDTGNNYYEDIISYIKSIGIHKLDYMIITHGDLDHIGNAVDIVKNFNVENVIFNNDEYNKNELELINILENKKIKYYKNIDKINKNIIFLNDKLYDNENDNSNIIYFNYSNYKFLFMGDAGIKRESDININNIDVLKVGHHGSITSTSKNFINKINSKYSIISVGKNNIYNHPSNEVLDNLKNTKIYRTDIDGSIKFEIYKNKIIIKKCNNY